MRKVAFCVAVCVMVVASVIGGALRAYATYGTWGVLPVVMYVNPANADVTASAAEAALQSAMNVWNTQQPTAFRFSYGGRVSDTTTSNDGRSVILFRNTSGGGLATTYAWSTNGYLTDSDIVFWDGAYRFFTGTNGCSGGMYIEDVAAHELGHSLGLSHTSVPDATMYPTASAYCSQSWRTLVQDDVDAVRSLYGSATPPPSNTAPTVSISAPSSGTSTEYGTSLTFAGAAVDTQDGTLTSSLVWTSSIDGQIGTGGSFSRVLSAGSHAIRASVTDRGGLTTVSQIAVTVTNATPTAPPPSGPTLSATGFKVKGNQQVRLSWTGLSSATVDVYRNGSRVLSTFNDGGEVDNLNTKGSATYVYSVCAAGTSTCTNTATVKF